MADMTLAEALAIADQDSPMPHLAGQALKVLRAQCVESDTAVRDRLLEVGWLPPNFEWLDLVDAPRDGTPVLVRVCAASALPEGKEHWAGLQFVARNMGDITEWCFAAPVGVGGFPDAWLSGWLHLPPKDC